MWSKGAISKSKESTIFRPRHLLFCRGKGTGKGFIMRAPMTDYLIGTDQKIPNRVININFGGRLKLQLNSLGFCTNDAILGPSAYTLLSPSATNP